MTPEIFQLGYQAENRLPPWEWAYINVRLRGSPYGERFVVDETPWLRDPLGTLTDSSIQEVVMNCCAQGGKTVTMVVALAYALDQKPGFTMFACQTKDEAKISAKEKIIPTIESVPSLAASLPVGSNRHKKATLEIYFANSTLLIGAANESFFRGKTAHWVFGDECSQWKAGKMEQARARQTRVWNRKAFFGSTPLECGPGAPGSEFDQAFKAGDQRKYHLAAPCCGELVYLTSENLEKVFTWEEGTPSPQPSPPGEGAASGQNSGSRIADSKAPGAETGPTERDWVSLRKTVRFCCPKCGEKTRQSEEIYRRMIAGARYVRMNPNAPAERVSFAFNVFCLPPSVMSWEKIVELYLRAKDEEAKGNLAPLKEFVTLRLAESWDSRRFLSYTRLDYESYNPTEEWPEEKFRALTVDCQEHLAEFWAVARAWGRDGSSRLLGFARLRTEAEIIQFQKEWKISSHLVALDAAYMPASVFDMCVRNNWAAMRGDDRRDFLVSQTGPAGVDVPVKQPFMLSRGDPRNGKSYQGRNYCPLFIWSNPTIKDILWNLKEGKGSAWATREIGGELDDIYAKGVDSERRREEIDRYGRTVLRWKKIRANHPWDCECMQVVFASMAKLFVFGGTSVPANAA